MKKETIFLFAAVAIFLFMLVWKLTGYAKIF